MRRCEELRGAALAPVRAGRRRCVRSRSTTTVSSAAPRASALPRARTEVGRSPGQPAVPRRWPCGRGWSAVALGVPSKQAVPWLCAAVVLLGAPRQRCLGLLSSWEPPPSPHHAHLQPCPQPTAAPTKPNHTSIPALNRQTQPLEAPGPGMGAANEGCGHRIPHTDPR